MLRACCTGICRGGASCSGAVQRDFLKLWVGQSVSLLGSDVTLLAMPLLAVLVLGASPGEMGVLRAVQFVPEFLALPIGVLVDRRPRRPLLIGADLSHGLLLTSIPVAALLGVLGMPQLYVVAVLSGALTVIFGVAYQAYLPWLVPAAWLLEANSRLQTSRSAAHAAGPAVAGAVIQALSAPAAILLDAVSFVVSAVFVAWIRAPEPPPQPPSGRSLWPDIVDGLRIVVKQPVLRALTLSSATWNFFSGGLLDALYILYLSREVQLGPAQVAGVVTSAGLAGIAGAMVCGRVSRWFGLGRTLIGGACLASLGTLAVPFIDPAEPLRLLGFIGVSVTVGFAQSLFFIGLSTLGQAFSPPEMLGRVMASRRFVLIGVVPFGALAGGYLGDTIGPRATLLVAGIGLLFTSVWLMWSPIRSLRTLA